VVPALEFGPRRGQCADGGVGQSGGTSAAGIETAGTERSRLPLTLNPSKTQGRILNFETISASERFERSGAIERFDGLTADCLNALNPTLLRDNLSDAGWVRHMCAVGLLSNPKPSAGCLKLSPTMSMKGSQLTHSVGVEGVDDVDGAHEPPRLRLNELNDASVRFNARWVRWRIQFNPSMSASVSCSLDHLIRSHQHVRRNRETNLLGRFEIDHQFELRRLLDRQVGWFGTF
jgi:hypothetical protein